MNHTTIINVVQHWLVHNVIGLNLCPFAKKEWQSNRIRFHVAQAESTSSLLNQLESELTYLIEHPDIETSLLIHPNVLTNFYDYNDFLALADALLIEMQLEGIIQIASFHPHYQFANTKIDDAENYSNRSPYPLLHLIREQSLEKAVKHYPHPENIPERNIALLNKMGKSELARRFQAHFKCEQE